MSILSIVNNFIFQHLRDSSVKNKNKTKFFEEKNMTFFGIAASLVFLKLFHSCCFFAHLSSEFSTIGQMYLNSSTKSENEADSIGCDHKEVLAH